MHEDHRLGSEGRRSATVDRLRIVGVAGNGETTGAQAVGICNERNRTMNIENMENWEIVRAARAMGCMAATVQGVKRFIEHRKGAVLDRLPIFPRRLAVDMRKIRARKIGYMEVGFESKDGEMSARYTFYRNNPKLRAVHEFEPTTNPKMHGQFTEECRRSGRWNTTHRTVFYYSVIRVDINGMRAIWSRHGKRDRVIRPPKGCYLHVDRLGFRIVDIDTGEDFHPSAAGMGSMRYKSIARANIDHKLAVVRRMDRERKEADDIERSYRRDIQRAQAGGLDVQVTLDDSLRSGNCEAGSLEFARRITGLTSDEIRKARHLIKIPGRVLLRTKNKLAMRAHKQAWMRETMVCI